MSGDLRLVLRITGDASALKAEVQGASQAVEGLGQGAGTAGQTATTALQTLERQAGSTGRQVTATGRAVEGLARTTEAAQAPVGGLNLRLAASEAAMGLLAAGTSRLSSLLTGALLGGVAGIAAEAASFAISLLRGAEATDQLREAQEMLGRTMQRSIEFFETATERAARLAAEQRALIAIGFSAEAIRAQNQLDAQRRALELLQRDRQRAIEDNRFIPGFNPDTVLAGPIAERRAEIERLEAVLASIERDRERALTAPSGAERDAAGRGTRTAPAGRGAAPRTADAFASIRQQSDQLTRSLRTPVEIYNEAVEQALALNRLFVASQGELGISSETLARALARAREEFDRTRDRTAEEQAAARQAEVFRDLGRLGEQAFDRVGDAITGALAQGQLDFRRLGQVGLAVAAELTRAFLQMAVVNPLRNAITGGSATTLGDAFGALSRLWSPAGSYGGVSPAGAIQPGQAYVPGISTGLHAGGIAGLEATFLRRVPMDLFDGAPRLHSGGVIGMDEVPAILRRGEGVFTAEQMARLGPAGATVNLTVNIAGTAADGAERDPAARRRLGEQIGAVARAELAAAMPAILAASQAGVAQAAGRGGAFAKEIGRR